MRYYRILPSVLKRKFSLFNPVSINTENSHNVISIRPCFSTLNIRFCFKPIKPLNSARYIFSSKQAFNAANEDCVFTD